VRQKNVAEKCGRKIVAEKSAKNVAKISVKNGSKNRGRQNRGQKIVDRKIVTAKS
jgi:hypothetical protein